MPDPTEAPCWPNDPDYLDGMTLLRLPDDPLEAHWDADVLDLNGKHFKPPIISIKEAFKIRYRVELKGRLWLCMAGRFCFDMGFAPTGAGVGFNLRDKLGAEKFDYEFRGCVSRCIDHVVDVPAGTIAAGECGTVYDITARFQLHCCEHKLSVATGFEEGKDDDLEFWDPDV